MKEKINELILLQAQYKGELREWVKDKSIPLEERWSTFIKSKLGEHRTSYEEFEWIDSDNYYDDYHIERHETVYIDKLYEQGITPRYRTNQAELNTEEKQQEFKEDVLNKFIYSFKMDW